MPDGSVPSPDSRSIRDGVVEIPLRHERIVFKEAPPGEDVCPFEFTLGKAGSVPLLHCHSRQDEIFRCRHGVLTIDLPGGRRTVGPGEELVVAAGTIHALYNDGDEQAVCDVEYRPAGRSREWLEISSAVMNESGKDLGLLDVAPFILDVGFFIAGPPRWLQTALFWVLRPVAIALGKKRAALRAAEEHYGRPFTW